MFVIVLITRVRERMGEVITLDQEIASRILTPYLQVNYTLQQLQDRLSTMQSSCCDLAGTHLPCKAELLRIESLWLSTEEHGQLVKESRLSQNGLLILLEYFQQRSQCPGIPALSRDTYVLSPDFFKEVNDNHRLSKLHLPASVLALELG